MRGRIIGTLLVTSLNAGVAGSCGGFIQFLLTDEAFGNEFYVLAPTIAAALVTPCAWWLIVIRKNRPGIVRGACAGAVSVLGSYPVFTLLATPALPQELRHDPTVWLFMLAMAVGATVWFALPIAVVVGGVLGKVQRWLLVEGTTHSDG